MAADRYRPIWKVIALFCIILLVFGCAVQKTTQPEVDTQTPVPPATASQEQVQPDSTFQDTTELQQTARLDTEVQEPAKAVPIQEITLPIIGEAEFVIIEPQGIRLAARIDTGATTSSLSATQIKKFERDGKKWVSFLVTDPASGKTETIKRPLVRTVSIKRHGAATQDRPVVSLQVSMGPIKQKSEFSLTDRSGFEYPALIGRSYLRGKAIVDVSREYALSPLGEN